MRGQRGKGNRQGAEKADGNRNREPMRTETEKKTEKEVERGDYVVALVGIIGL